MKRIIILALIFINIALMNIGTAYAWSQSAHEEINGAAWYYFKNNYIKNTKYANTSFDTETAFPGIKMNFKESPIEGNLTSERWISDGGFSADFPSFFQARRHFYDPLAQSGVNYLTDIVDDWIVISNPKIDARSWAIDHKENPFSFKKGMEYLKKALETPLKLKDPMTVTVMDKKREGDAKQFNDAAALRAFLAGKAYRSLGETLHLVGDMSQPAHVRNDGHPFEEPLEDAVKGSMAIDLVDKVDKANPAKIDYANSEPFQLFHQMALFTNENFYSEDTIFDRENGVWPRNGETEGSGSDIQKIKFYDHPQFKELTEYKIKFDGDSAESIVLGREIGGKKVPVVEKTLGKTYFGNDAPIEYHITSKIVEQEGEILVPMAIKGGARMIDLFIPTLRVDTKVQEKNGPDGSKNLLISASVVHEFEKDFMWNKYIKDNDSTIKAISYSGPGWLVKKGDKGSKEKLAELEFSNGNMVQWKAVNGKMFAPAPMVATTGNTMDLLVKIQSGDELQIITDAAGLNYKSKPIGTGISFKIEPNTISTTIGKQVNFKAVFDKTPESDYYIVWNAGDGQAEKSGIINAKEGSLSFAKPGKYTVSAKLFVGKDKNVAAMASATVEVTQEAAPTPKPDVKKPTPSQQPAKPADTNPSGILPEGTYRVEFDYKIIEKPIGSSKLSFHIEFTMFTLSFDAQGRFVDRRGDPKPTSFSSSGNGISFEYKTSDAGGNYTWRFTGTKKNSSLVEGTFTCTSDKEGKAEGNWVMGIKIPAGFMN